MKEEIDTHTVNKSYGLITYKNLNKHENCYDSILTATKPYRKLKRICDKTKQPRRESKNEFYDSFEISNQTHSHKHTTLL